MIKGIGTDIIEVSRIGKKVEGNTSFKKKIFTDNEIKYCETYRHKAQNYAVRFAAKEAFLKAIGTGWSNGLAFDQIEIINDKSGKPELFLNGKASEVTKEMGIKNIHVSLSHVKEYAIAVVIIED
ncbi:MAG: holo-ACP synthase [Bacteroidales bacterium]|nr:holo-ACP synthase [Bacteroidales bacterium]